MSDFETRLTEALISGAERAPDHDRLVAGARSRARSRRRTRYAAVAGAVVVALGVPVGVLALNGDGDDSSDGSRVATDPTQEPAPDWQTVDHEGIKVEVPGDWQQLDTSACEFEFVRFGPRGSAPCTYDHDGLAFYGSATFDPAQGAGVLTEDDAGWSGYVYAGDWAVWTQAGDRDLLRGILASARTDGQDVPDLSAGWRTETEGKLSVDVPASWRDGGLSAWCLDETVPGWVERPDTVVAMIRCEPSTGYGIRLGAGSKDDWIRERHGGSEYPEGSWAGVAIAPDASGKPIGFVQVVAPTQGLAELIGGSLRAE
jgi:hypothetical protein